MTTGSRSTGSNASSFLSGFQSSKQWSGTDGKYTTQAGQRQLKWNTYSMSHRKWRIPTRVSASSNYTHVRIRDNVLGTDTYGPESAIEYAATWSLSPLDPAFSQAKFDALWTQKDEYRLLAKLLNKVKGHSFNAGVAFAEVDKFASGVLSTVKQFGFGAADLANGRIESFARRFGTYPPNSKITRKLMTRDFSGRFLEMRYAWQPAVKDAYEASKAFEALSNGPRKNTFKVSGYRVAPVLVTGDWIVTESQGLARRTYTYEAYEELSVLRQMGLGNPASILWERIPYSFVVDWFLPIGTYLELIGQVPFLKGRFMRSDSYEEIYTGKYTVIAQPPGARYTVKTVPGLRSVHYSMSRTVPGSLSVPFPSMKVAGAVEGRRLQNALALTHQIFAQAAVFVAGTPRLSKGKIKFGDDGISKNLLLRLSRF